MKLKLFLGWFLAGAALALYAAGKPLLLKEAAVLEKAVPYTAPIQDSTALYVAQGVVAENSAVVRRGFVICNREAFTGTGRLNGWKVEQAYLQPFYLMPENGGVLHVALETVPERGTGLSVAPAGEHTDRGMNIRYKGLKHGDTVTVVFQTAAVGNPVPVVYAYAGTLPRYRELLADGSRLFDYLCGTLFFMATVLIVWQLVEDKEKKNKRTH